MTRAGFSSNQIIYTAPEIISQMSNSVRMYRDVNKRRMPRAEKSD
jgi:hypothetical protein